jgi:hypothetical protein
MISTLVLIGAACMYTEAYPRGYIARTDRAFISDVGSSAIRLQLQRISDGLAETVERTGNDLTETAEQAGNDFTETAERAENDQIVMSRRSIAGLLSPSGSIGSGVKGAMAKLFSQDLMQTRKQPWACKAGIQWSWKVMAEKTRRYNRLYQCTNSMDGRKFILQAYPQNSDDPNGESWGPMKNVF